MKQLEGSSVMRTKSWKNFNMWFQITAAGDAKKKWWPL